MPTHAEPRASPDTDCGPLSAERPHLTPDLAVITKPYPRAGKMVSKRMRCLALISHNNMKPAMQACLLVTIVPTPLPHATRTLCYTCTLPRTACTCICTCTWHVLNEHVHVAAHHQPQSYTFYPAHTTPAPFHSSALEPHPIADTLITHPSVTLLARPSPRRISSRPTPISSAASA